MRRIVALLILLVASSVFGAAGDVQWATVETNGWVLQVNVASIATNGAFNFGFATNNSGRGNVVVLVNSAGYNSDGTAATVRRTIYGTKVLRLPYPAYAQNDITNSGSDAVFRCGLSDYIYASDTITSITFSNAVYSTSSAATLSGATATNLSTQVWAKPICNWSWVPYEKTSTTFTLRSVGFHKSAVVDNAGRPVKAVRMRSNSATHGETNFATLTIDGSLGDAKPVPEWVVTVNATGFAQGEFITNNYDIYTACGDSVFSTDGGLFTGLPPFPAPFITVCDKNGTFSQFMAVVDPVIGTSNGRATNVASDTLVATNCYFDTIDHAATQLAASNNLYSSPAHNDIAGSKIRLHALVEPQGFSWVGGSGTYGTNVTSAWIEIEKYSTNTVDGIRLNAQSGNQRLSTGSNVKFSQITFTNFGTLGGIIFGHGGVWLDRCVINSTNIIFQRATNCYFTRCTVPYFVQGFKSSSDISNPVLIRGCTFPNYTNFWVCHTVLGNARTGDKPWGASFLYFQGAIANTANCTNSIVAFNSIDGLRLNGNDMGQYPIAQQAWGIAFVQNDILATTTGSSALLSIANDSCVIDQNNVLLWYNTLLGGKTSWGYNDLGTAPMNRFGWSLVGNISQNTNIKGDTFPGNSLNGARVGNFPVLYGVGFYGNAWIQTTNIGAAGSFCFEFAGRDSYQPPVISASGIPSCNGSPLALDYSKFISDASAGGSGVGGGDYRLQSLSPLIYNIKVPWLLPVDLDGYTRGVADVPGAHVTGNPRRNQ